MVSVARLRVEDKFAGPVGEWPRLSVVQDGLLFGEVALEVAASRAFPLSLADLPLGRAAVLAEPQVSDAHGHTMRLGPQHMFTCALWSFHMQAHGIRAAV